MTHDVVDGDAGGEGDSSLEALGLLAGEHFLHFLLDEGVDCLANRVDICTWNGELDSLCESG